MSALPMAAAIPIVICTDSPLETLVELWMKAKGEEDAANGRRLEIEQRITALLPPPEEGSVTHKLDNGFKLTLTGKLGYRCEDARALAEACAGWPANMVPIKTEVKLDETGAKWLRANEPEAWATVARFVTVKPAKTAVKVAV